MTCWPIQVVCGFKAANPRAWPGSTQTYFFLYCEASVKQLRLDSEDIESLTSRSPPYRLTSALPAEDSIQLRP
jgi:hypothetical protein